MLSGEHGRELITGELVYRFMQTFDFDAMKSQQPSSKGIGKGFLKPRMEKQTLIEVASPQWMLYLLRNVEMVLVPTLSMWARRQAERNDTCNRKTESGVLFLHLAPIYFDLLISCISNPTPACGPPKSCGSEPKLGLSLLTSRRKAQVRVLHGPQASFGTPEPTFEGFRREIPPARLL